MLKTINTTCPQCHARNDCTSHPDTALVEMPQPGVWALCIECGGMNVFDSELDLRFPSEAEQRLIDASDNVMNLRMKWAIKTARVKKPLSEVNLQRIRSIVTMGHKITIERIRLAPVDAAIEATYHLHMLEQAFRNEGVELDFE